MRTATIMLLGAAGLLLLQGCCCPQRSAGCEEVVVTAAKPLPDGPYAKDTRQGVWSYLLTKYDKDDDGAISAEEHGRGEKAFRNLDRDQDGSVTEKDLVPGPVHGLMVVITLMHAFQADEDLEDLKLAEVEASFAVHDKDKDGELTSKELAAAQASRGHAAKGVPTDPGGMDAFLSLRLLGDTDGNGTLSQDELVALFRKRAGDDDRWEPRARRQGPPAGMIRPDGPAAGEPAPDFTLAAPDGSTTVTLSAFRGVKPVALIFGSYT